MGEIDIQGMLPTIGYMVAIFAVFYFILIMPQKKKDKQHKAMVEAVKKGDEIITIGGIHGKVTSVKNPVITIETADKGKLKIENWAIRSLEKVSSEKVTEPGEEAKDGE